MLALRNLMRAKGYTLLNLFGMASGTMVKRFCIPDSNGRMDLRGFIFIGFGTCPDDGSFSFH